jgi:hypothetical protein
MFIGGSMDILIFFVVLFICIALSAYTFKTFLEALIVLKDYLDLRLEEKATVGVEDYVKNLTEDDDTDIYLDDFISQPHIRKYDERIQRMKEELAKTVDLSEVGEGTDAEMYHPAVYNLNHEEVDKELQAKVLRSEVSE